MTKKYTELKTKNMMFNQPPTSEKMYFILSPLGEMDIPVHVAFDDAQTAEAYISRFKTYSDARIVECQLNPGFYTDITRDCYFVLINNYNDEYSIYLVNDLKGSEKALNREYFFKGDQICIYLMASSEKEAVRDAIKIRDKAIENNEIVLDKE